MDIIYYITNYIPQAHQCGWIWLREQFFSTSFHLLTNSDAWKIWKCHYFRNFTCFLCSIKYWAIFLLTEFDLTFQRWFVSFSNENNHNSDVKHHPSWLGYKEVFDLHRLKWPWTAFFYLFILLKNIRFAFLQEDFY